MILIILSLSLAVGPAICVQPAARPPAVGVDEHLGAVVPLDAHFNDEDGRPVKLGALLDKPVILTLNFFRCAGICTPLLNGLTDSLNEIKLEPGKDFRVVTVSFDPKDDHELAKMKRLNYIRQFHRPFPVEAWRFLTGRPQDIKALTEAVGFHYQPAPGGQFVHPGVIVILSPQGKVTRYMYGIEFSPYDLQMALLEAARGVARPSVVKALQFCYDYDPVSRSFVFRLTRIVGAVTLMLALALIGALGFWPRRKA